MAEAEGRPVMPTAERGRTLGTARAVLRVLALLWQHPQGVGVREAAALTGKSTWTARYLLNSLCQEGLAVRVGRSGVYRPTVLPSATGRGVPSLQVRERTPSPPLRGRGVDLDRVRDGIRELSRWTRERAYLALVEGDRVVVADVVGRQGLPLLRGVDPALRGQAHALAIGKAVLAHAGPEILARYLEGEGLRRFTSTTITEGRALARELEAVRRSGFAVDREEFREGFCCLAIPIFHAGELVGSMGVAVPASRFEREGEELRLILGRVGRWISTGGEADGSGHARPGTAAGRMGVRSEGKEVSV
jgi:DNA-binding IclR family transcriptional regulator